MTERIEYLGALFNSKGTNSDLVDGRIKKARACMINSLSMCGDVTLGAYAVESLTLVYKSVFIPTLLYGCQVWTRMTKNEETKLQTIQLQFLKRILHVPRSTCNCFVFLELGVLPVLAEIHTRKLNFLHHILSLGPEDPVLQTYKQQLLYEAEKNWANECQDLMESYGLERCENKIKETSKEGWKKQVKEAVRKEWLFKLNEEKSRKKKITEMNQYEELKCRQYLIKLRSDRARLLFRIRGKITKIKEHRQYEYSEDNMDCRLCGVAEETLNHVICGCGLLDSPVAREGGEQSEELEVLESVVARVKEFLDKVDDMMNVDM